MLMLCSTSQSCTFKMCINQADFFLKNYSYLQPIDKFSNLKESTKGCEKSSLSVCVSQQASKWHCLICHTAAKSTTASASFLPLWCIQNKFLFSLQINYLSKKSYPAQLAGTWEHLLSILLLFHCRREYLRKRLKLVYPETH